MRRRDRISSRQLGALALTGAGIPVFRLCCRVSWVWVLPGAGGAALLLSLLTRRLNRRGRETPGRGGPSLFWALLFFAAALLAAWESSFAFPETGGNWLAALLVLVLAWAAAGIGPASPARCAGILLWVTGGLYGSVLLFSLPQLRWERLAPSGSPTDALAVLIALLLPGAALSLGDCLGEDQSLPQWPWWTQAAGALAASLVTGGILSAPLAREPEAFRTLARGVSVLGVIRRFEALVNGALLMSGFSLCSLYLTGLEKIFEKMKKGVDK